MKPVRNSGSFEINGGDSEWFPSGRRGLPTGTTGNKTWISRPGRWGSGMDIGGGQSLPFTGFGYGHLGGPAGPTSGNLPMPHLPGDSGETWWNPQGLPGGSWPSALTRCISLVVGGALATPMTVTRKDDPTQLDLPRWLLDPMGVTPKRGVQDEVGTGLDDEAPLWPAAMRLTRAEFWSSVCWWSLNFGRGAFIHQVTRDAEGVPSPRAGSFLLVDPFALTIDKDSGCWVFYEGSDNELATDADGRFMVGSVEYQLKVMRGMAPHDEATGDWFGGVITRHWATVNELRRIQDFTVQMFDSATPSGVLSVKTPAGFNAKDAQQLKDSWNEAHGGGKSGGVAVLNSTVEYQTIGRQRMLDMDLPAVHKASIMSIAHAYRMSAVHLDVGDSLTYTTKRDARQDLVDSVLRQFATSWTDLLHTMLPAGQRATIRFDQYINPSQEDLVAAWLPAYQAGVVTLEEIRAKIGLPPLSGDAVDEDSRR